MFLNHQIALVAIFVLALILRFLYFPDNIYFGYDQARDAYAAQAVLKGDLKIIGPTTSFEGLSHGPLYYYIFAPFYGLGGGNPEVVSAFLRVLNALGVFLVFAVATSLFNKYVGIFSALLFAFSFEQTQFSIYLNHPSLAVISMMLMYWGLALLIFKKQKNGLFVSLLGLGLSIQFEFILTYLTVPFVLTLIIFRKDLPRLDWKTIAASVTVFILPISTYILAEVKFGFRSLSTFLKLAQVGQQGSILDVLRTFIFEVSQMIKYNLVGDLPFLPLAVFIILAALSLLTGSKYRKYILFLSIWFFSLIIVYLVNGGVKNLNETLPVYYPNVGISIVLLIYVSLLLHLLFKKNSYIAVIFSIVILLANINLITGFNKSGSINEFNAQSFMLLSDEKKVIDFIYQTSNNQPFAVKAITMPFSINTTWSYLFEWYGQQRHGYLPVWGSKNAIGYYGNLEVVEAQDALPQRRFVIIEPLRGIPVHLVNQFISEENLFSDLIYQHEIGHFVIQDRQKKD